jgi:hypothetical protein
MIAQSPKLCSQFKVVLLNIYIIFNKNFIISQFLLRHRLEYAIKIFLGHVL